VDGLTDLISNPGTRSMLHTGNTPAAHGPGTPDTAKAWPQRLAAAKYGTLPRFALQKQLFRKYANIRKPTMECGDCVSGVLAVRHKVLRCKLGFRESAYKA